MRCTVFSAALPPGDTLCLAGGLSTGVAAVASCVALRPAVVDSRASPTGGRGGLGAKRCHEMRSASCRKDQRQ